MYRNAHMQGNRINKMNQRERKREREKEKKEKGKEGKKEGRKRGRKGGGEAKACKVISQGTTCFSSVTRPSEKT